MLLTVVAPSVEPVSLIEVKQHLRVDGSHDDALIAACISAARESIELHTGRALVAATYRWLADDMGAQFARLPLWPVATVTQVAHTSSLGARTVLAEDVYSLEGDRALLALDELPSGYLEVTFTTPPLQALPPSLRFAIFLMVSDLYDEGRGVITGTTVAVNPVVARLTDPMRINLGI